MFATEAAAEIVENRDRMAAGDQRLGDVRSDEPGAAGDEHFSQDGGAFGAQCAGGLK